MKTLTIDEAVAGRPMWLELALAGEEIQIRQGDSIVELRPATSSRPASASGSLAHREVATLTQADFAPLQPHGSEFAAPPTPAQPLAPTPPAGGD